MKAYLTYYPISKNILMLASNFYKEKGKKENFKFNLRNYAREGEVLHLKRGGHDLGTPWHPWLWSRIERNKNINKTTGWELYFNDWESVNFTGDEVVDLGLCCQSIFNLKDHMIKIINEEKRKIGWDKYKEVSGMHVRRGEVYLKDNPKADWGVCRSYYTIDEYMIALKKISDNKIVYLSSDSNETLKYLEENYKEYTFLTNTYDKNKFMLPKGNDKFKTIEGYCANNPDTIEFYVNTALIDLYFLGQCNKFVGTIKISCYSKIAYLLMCGNLKKRIDYYDMDKPNEELKLNNGNDGLLLF